jgi:hypothetical protein
VVAGCCGELIKDKRPWTRTTSSRVSETISGICAGHCALGNSILYLYICNTSLL